MNTPALAVLRHMLTPPRRGVVFSTPTPELQSLDADGFVSVGPQHDYSDPRVRRWEVTGAGRSAFGLMMGVSEPTPARPCPGCGKTTCIPDPAGPISLRGCD